jgi:acetylornithine deacetylase
MLSADEARVLAAIDAGADEVVALLQQLLAFETITPDDAVPVTHDHFIRHQACVREYVESIGFGDIDLWEVDAAALEAGPGSGVLPDRDLRNMPVLAARLPGAGHGRSLILNGHYDVVPLGLRESWTRDPFGREIADGKVYGRGSNDMKGGIAAMLKAVEFIRRAGLALEGDVLVEIVPDEEATCMGTLSACQRGYRADAAIIPEPTDMRVGIAVRGHLGGEITVRGRAGHAEQAQPPWQQGGAVNAIDKAARVITAMQRAQERWHSDPAKQHPLVPPDSIVPTVIRGGEWSATYPEKVEIVFDCMFVPGALNKRAELESLMREAAAGDAWLEAHPPELRFSGPKGDVWWYAAELSPDEPIVQLAQAALADVGLAPALMGFGSLTDCIHLIHQAKVPTINLGPDFDTGHAADEFVSIEQLVQLTKTLALAILRWSGARAAR